MKAQVFLLLVATGCYAAVAEDVIIAVPPPSTHVKTNAGEALTDGTTGGTHMYDMGATSTVHVTTRAATNIYTVPASATNACPVRAAGPGESVFTVQLGAFSSRERAFSLYWELSKKLSPLQVSPKGKDGLYRVRYGSFPNRKEAQACAERVRKKGIPCFVTSHENAH